MGALTPVQLAWAAGIFDGEGCISLRFIPQRGSHQLRIAVNSTDGIMAKKFHEWFGGRYRSRVDRRYPRRPIAEWYAQGKLAGKVLTILQPYLLVKAQQADLAIAYVETIQENKGGDGPKISDEMRDLRFLIERQLRLLKVVTLDGGEYSVKDIKGGAWPVNPYDRRV